MGQHRHKKPEASHIRGVCVLCKNNPQKKRGENLYRALCSPCDKREFDNSKPHRKVVENVCKHCQFTSEHPCQFDVDHIDGNHENNSPENLQTLCANCHRLKSYLSRDFNKKTHRP